MLFDRNRPHAFRVLATNPARVGETVAATERTLKARADRCDALQAYALHRAHDDMRIVAVEAWRDEAAYRAHPDAQDKHAMLYTWAATGGREPTPVDDAGAGVIVIDTFQVWRPLLGPVSRFNIRNGEAFNRAPGCISTTVLRGLGVGSIATYARWRSVEDFAAAFSQSTGKLARTTDDINRTAARMTLGLIHPDYHSYELIAFEERSR